MGVGLGLKWGLRCARLGVCAILSAIRKKSHTMNIGGENFRRKPGHPLEPKQDFGFQPYFSGHHNEVAGDPMTHEGLRTPKWHVYDVAAHHVINGAMEIVNGFIPKLCRLAQEVGKDERVQPLRSAGLQALSTMTLSTQFFMVVQDIHDLAVVNLKLMIPRLNVMGACKMLNKLALTGANMALHRITQHGIRPLIM
nr:armadillo-type fold [Tanacetum cinerariifolium]